MIRHLRRAPVELIAFLGRTLCVGNVLERLERIREYPSDYLHQLSRLTDHTDRTYYFL